MKKWLLLVPLLLGLSQFSTGQAVTTLDQNCNLWGAAPATPQCGGTTSAASGTQQFFPDIRGTITNQFEVLVQGTAPGSLTVTVVGCMRGGTCSSTLASSSGTASQILTPAVSALNVYDKYGVTVSWTGGDATTRFVVNRTGTVAKLSGSGGNGTVTNTGGTLTANAVVLGAGGSDTKVSTGITTNGASELDLGLNGTASGVLGLNGSASGKATCTAPAVAGTTTNPVSCTNNFLAPAFSQTTNGTGGFTNPGNSAFWQWQSANQINLSFASLSNAAIFGLTGMQLAGNKGEHIATQAAANDLSGTCTLSSGTCTITFTTAYTSAPACVATPSTTGTFTTGATLKVNASTTTVVFTSTTGTDSAVINYLCFGNPN